MKTLNPVYEGLLNALFTIETDSPLQAGVFVKYGKEEGTVELADKDNAIGLLSQDVKIFDAGAYRSPVRPIAGKGEKVAIYQEGGVYKTALFDDKQEYIPGNELYFDPTDKVLTNAETVDGRVVATYICMVGGMLQFQLSLQFVKLTKLISIFNYQEENSQ